MSKTRNPESEKAFQDAYATLNPQQKEAVDTIEGPVMVIAGPGTGKTQILTLRIANILLQTDAKPEDILALTFTESGAKAMRERLRRYIGAQAYRVHIHTFHGFAQTVIREYPDAYPKIVGGRPASDLERISLLETILEDPTFKAVRPLGDPAYYVGPILQQVSTLKREYITPDGLAQIIARQEETLADTPKEHTKGAHKGKVRGEYQKLEKTIAKNQELLAVYQQYEALLQAQKRYDYDDMITTTVAVLESDESVLRDLQETYQYVLADEHQDVNGSQNKILELLASYHERPNIFVVGDEKQAIYRFQGASLENFLYFEDHFAHTKTIALSDNYRSGQTILDVAHSLIAVEDGPLADLRVPLDAKAVKESVVTTQQFSHQAVEDAWLVSAVHAELEKGTSPEEVAIIVRTNKEVEQYAGALRAAGVQAAASAESDILAHPLTQTVLQLLQAVVNPAEEAALARVLHGNYWGISRSDLLTLLSARSYDQSLTKLLTDPQLLTDLGLEDPEPVMRVCTVLEEARKQSGVSAAHTVVAALLESSGLLQEVSAQEPIESGRVIRRLYDEIQGMVLAEPQCTLESVYNQLARLYEHNIALSAPYITTDSQAVQVMTAHKSKGLEFACVFVPHLSDNTWGGKRRRELFSIPLTKHLAADDFDPLDDEKRLLYVAMTRAKQTLYLSCADTNIAGKGLSPSRLLEFLDSDLITVANTAIAEEQFDPLQALTTVTDGEALPVAFFAKTLAERGFSATSLNNYLKSPWNYIYRNILRLPEVQGLPMQFGTAMHDVLERVTTDHTKNQTWTTDTQLKVLLEQALGRLAVTKEEYVRLHEKGFTALVSYCAQLKGQLPARTKSEFSLRVMLPTGLAELPEIPLTGKLDRLDFDDEGKVVRVVDYKTGKPKTRNHIEGKTQSSDGDYKRQLTFYALLLSLYENESYQCRTGVLSFVEPDTKGVIKEEEFVITDQEITDLKEEIIKATTEILSGDFLSAACDPETSDYCHLADKLLQKK